MRANSTGADPAASASVKISSKDTKEKEDKNDKVRVSYADAKRELQEEVRKSLIRDASAVLVPTSLPGEGLIEEMAKEGDTASNPSQFVGFDRVLN